MRAQIETLAALQSLDREIKEQNLLKAELLGAFQATQAAIESKKREVDSLAAAFAEKDKQRQEKDRVIQDEGRKAMDKRMRMNRIKNVKELQALQREIDQIRQGNMALEEELLEILLDLDGIKAELKAKEEELARMQKEWTEKQETVKSQISGIEQTVLEASLRRQGIASQLARDLISRYELIFARRGGMAVVEVSGGICQGCYMNIPPQLWNEIIRNEKVNLCPSCQRILYHKPATAQEKPA